MSHGGAHRLLGPLERAGGKQCNLGGQRNLGATQIQTIISRNRQVVKSRIQRLYLDAVQSSSGVLQIHRGRIGTGAHELGGGRFQDAA